ncbi:sigma-70 family RNA polymerase sigma factor [soil metagenome]
MTEAELLERARRGDADAVQALYREHAPRVYATVRRLAGEDAEAEDWAQETWVRALRALPTFRGDARFGTWLHRIAVNQALQGLRRSQRRLSEVPLSAEHPARPRLHDALLERRLERALDTLPPRMREVLVLHDVEGYTHEEIGDLMGVSAGTCKSQLFKARSKLRELLRPLREPAQTLEMA